MDFINFVLPDSALSNDISSPVILKTRREELGLTQQQVATGARLQLVQYQRLERGERTKNGAGHMRCPQTGSVSLPSERRGNEQLS